MNRKALFFATAAGVATSLLPGAAALAQASRTFVSGHGSDTGLCAVGAPCRSFAYAITQTAAAGEIVVLDSAGYGPVTITQSLTITNPGGVEAGVTATSGTDAITINAGGPTAITLRGLTLEGGGAGRNGINVESALPVGSPVASTLNILGCVVKDFTLNGIAIEATSVGDSGSRALMVATISDSFIVDNYANGSTGLNLASGIHLNVGIYRTIVNSNTYGIMSTADTAYLVDSHVDYSPLTGINVQQGQLTMKNSTAVESNLGAGTDVDANSVGQIALFNGNTIGRVLNGTTIITDGTNNITSLSGNAMIKQLPE